MLTQNNSQHDSCRNSGGLGAPHGITIPLKPAIQKVSMTRTIMSRLSMGLELRIRVVGSRTV